MIAAPVEVVAPSRLHFGMFSFGQSTAREFGGAGVMIDQPGLKLRITPCAQFSAAGPLAARVRSIVERLAEAWGLDALPGCHVEVVSAPPDHIGLGTGTQLALSVTAGLQAFRMRSPLDAALLAELSGRGGRSAIGTYGFLQGGLLVEGGKLGGETLGPLEHHIALPPPWRFVLICPLEARGLSGEAERFAFGRLPPVSPETAAALRREVADELVPAATAGDFARFSASVARFNRQAGECFAAVQGGPYASSHVAELIAAVCAAGVLGAGQSSWGPTVFAIVENDASARQLVERLQTHLERDDVAIIAEPNDTGARITRGGSDG